VGAAEAVGGVVVVGSVGCRGSVCVVDFGEFGSGRRREAAGAVDDPGPHWGRDAGSTEHVPAHSRGCVGVIDPHPGVGVGVRGDVGHEFGGTGRKSVLISGTGFVCTGSAAAVVPCRFTNEIGKCDWGKLLAAADGVHAADGGATNADHVGRSAGPNY